MQTIINNRRAFLRSAAGACALLGAGGFRDRTASGEEKTTSPKIPQPFSLQVFTGTPRERGKAYGQQFAPAIDEFLQREVYKAFTDKPSSKDGMLRYAAACGAEVKKLSPSLAEEVEGIAEGAGKTPDELVLMSLHEELYHKSPLPMHGHCTAVAAGPPTTSDGHTYVGQTWDWMQSVAGMSSLNLLKRKDGPSLLAYGFPGLWVGAGMNSAGLALCWTSAALGDGKHGAGPRVGIPSYLLLTHLLYQESLDDAINEAKRAKQAGWFTFVLADAKGRLANIEGSPEKLSVEMHKGELVRVLYGSRRMTGTEESAEVKLHDRCQKMYGHLKQRSGKVNGEFLRECFASGDYGICVGPSTIDMMVYDTTARRAWLSRGPEYGVEWREFGFE